MRIHYGTSHTAIANPVVTIGIFDGIHIGHRQIIKHLHQLASSIHGETVVVTLWPHPRYVLNPDQTSLKLLTTLDEKIEILKKEGIHHLIILPFTPAFSKISFTGFIEKILVDQIGARHVIIGFNHHFGHDRQGTFSQLEAAASVHGFRAERLGPFYQQGKVISSSHIRELIASGHVALAAQMLERPYSLHGRVIEGKKIGRELGFPTANLFVEEENKLFPMTGVYAVKVHLEDSFYQGMLNIGIRPTLNEAKQRQTIEVHLFNFSGDLYGKILRIEFIERIRDEMKFVDIGELARQLALDKELITTLFKKKYVKAD